MQREPQMPPDAEQGRPLGSTEISIEVRPLRVVAILLVVVVSLIVIGLATQLYVELVDAPAFRRLADRFDLDEEITVPTWYAASTLLLCSALIAVIATGVRQRGGPFTKSWFGLAIIFLLISIDEGSGFHELSMRELRAAFDLPSWLHFAWVIPGAVVLVAFAAVYLRFWLHLPPRTRWLFALAATLFVTGAMGFEVVGGHITATRGQHNLAFQLVATAEESLEMLGVLVFIGALLDYLGRLCSCVRIIVGGAQARAMHATVDFTEPTSSSVSGARYRRPVGKG